MRPLSLHVSALSDAEYDLYTASFDDLATDTAVVNTNTRRSTHVRDDARYEHTSVGVREARAWLRGRFSDIQASDIEAILKLFRPNMLPSDTLTGGQFFAALRLVLHVDSGKAVDRTLAFIQALPRPAKALDPTQQLSPPKRPVQAPPPAHPDRQKPVLPPETNPFVRRSVEHATMPAPAPPLPTDPDPTPPLVSPQKRPSKITHNPFLARDKPETGVASTNVSSQAKLPPLPPRKPAVLAVPLRRASEVVPPTPPLVPVKPTHVMSPLMRQSLEASKHAQSIKRAEEQLDRERVLQVLKSTSISGTSSGSSSSCNTTPGMRTRSLSPAKQSQKLSSAHLPDAESDDAKRVPPIPRRRKPSLPLSSRSSSVLSLEQVANATLPPPTAVSASSRPPLPSREHVITHSGVSTTQTDCLPPPTHPAHRRPSTSMMAATTTDPATHDTHTPRPSIPSDPSESPPAPPPPPPPRLGRSNSLAASFMATGMSTSAGASMPLPPPPRRKRPESVQISPTLGSDVGDLPFTRFSTPTGAGVHGRTTSYHGQGLSRHLSLTREREKVKERGRQLRHESSPADPPTLSPFSTVANVASVAGIQRTFANLQPKLDAVRYKAEAGLSKRGYVHHAQLGSIIRRRLSWREEGEEGLMADTRWSRNEGRGDAGDKCDSSAIGNDTPIGYSNDLEPTTDSDEMFGFSATDKVVAPHRETLTESDNLKWPMGQGWKQL